MLQLDNKSLKSENPIFVLWCDLKARGGGGGKRHFFSFYICDRAAEDEQVEKNRIKIRQCIPEILHAKV